MVQSVAFDTLAYAKKLEGYGISNQHAEGHSAALAEVLEMNYVVKKEFESAVDRFDRHLSECRTEFNLKLHKEISSAKVEIVKWVFAVAFAQSAFIFSTIKFLH